MNKIRVVRPRILRTAQAVMATFALLAGVCAGTGTAYAEDETVAAVIPSTEWQSYNLGATAQNLRATVDAGLLANTSLDPTHLLNLPYTGTGRAPAGSTCYPEPFHPGARAEGYCWNNSDDTGLVTNPDRWTPQGFSIPHHPDPLADGTWPAGGPWPSRWEVVSFHGITDGQSEAMKFRFVERSQINPRYLDIFPIEVDEYGHITHVRMHADGIVWYGNNLILGSDSRMLVFDLDDLQVNNNPSTTSNYANVLPVSYEYSTSPTRGKCVSRVGTTPCLNSLSFDRANSALVSAEYQGKNKAAKEGDMRPYPSPQGRIIRWPFNLYSGLPQPKAGSSDVYAKGAWRSTIVGMQGAVYTGGNFYLSGYCPYGWNINGTNGYIFDEASCIYRGTANTDGSFSAVITTMAPDMTQNLDWDPQSHGGEGRLRGISEANQNSSVDHPQRMVFELKSHPDPIDDFKLVNKHSGKCIYPYLHRLKDNLTIIQGNCTGRIAESWYWDGPFLRNFQSKRCLSVKDGSSAANAVLVQFECKGYPTQNWYESDGSAGGKLLVNNGSVQCATPNNSSQLDTHLVQWPCYAAGASHNWIRYG
ncbi:RICIN domain-containing protein [Streptomyces sp. NPDC048603]|uniref:RICIN domain-containing protein n=1 Tax=Streptomyces sp. NPDC048603 TaxID=3365577 RepID=UPI003712E234